MASTEKTISFRAAAKTIEKLDRLADSQDRPRSYLINEAIANYVQLHEYHEAQVRRGLKAMKEGRLISHAEVVRRLRKRMG